jgi:hypothetical protein
MDVERIIQEFRHHKKLPVEAIRAARANRETLVPRFIAAFEEFTEGNNRNELANVLFFAFYLLGEWREKSAYRPLARFLRCPSEDVDLVLGDDGVTGHSHRVMAAVFDGSPQPLYELILDPAADQFVRSRMCEVVAMVTLRGAMQRDDAASFLRACFAYLTPQQDCFVWDGWQSAVALLGLTELRPLVEEAFNRGSIDPSWMRFKHFEEDLQWALEHPEAPYQRQDEYTLWGDSIEELLTWWSFSKDTSKEQISPRELYLPGWLSEPAVNPYREIGRNDPCPCGSGKKFKKCCLQALAA